MFLIDPFIEFEFMRKALVACVALSLSAAPIGIFLSLRRMALVGDAMSHAILPGISLAFLFFGISLWHMTIGGLIAGILVTFAAGLISRTTNLKEDTSFGGLYLVSLAAGVILISLKGTSIDLMHILFGNVLAVQDESLYMAAGICTLTLCTLAIIYRALVMECFDSGFLKSVGGKGAIYHFIFIGLIVLNLVTAFQAFGTLMALGMMILPAAIANFWAKNIDYLIPTAALSALVCGVSGLLLSYYYNLPTGPAIIVVLGSLYVASIFVGRHNSIRAKYLSKQHVTR
jgi:zinc/manganese transport system permease protein